MASEINWIKITTGMFEDEKIEFIETMPEGDSIFKIWIRLLCMAGRCNAGGYIFITEKIPYTEDAMVSKFKKPLSVVRLALKVLSRLEMIHIDEKGFIGITNWAKHQNIDGMEKIREQNRLRAASYRKRLRLTDDDSDRQQNNVTSNVTDNVSVTQSSISYSSSESYSQNSSEENLKNAEIREESSEEKQARPFFQVESTSKIFEDTRKHWNSKGLPVYKHTLITCPRKDKEKILNSLSAYGFEDVKTAIDNYVEIITNPGKYEYDPRFQYRAFPNFMERGVGLFTDDVKPFDRCARNRKESVYQEPDRSVPALTPEEEQEIAELKKRVALSGVL